MGSLHKGYFPKNYVKPKVWNDATVPQPPPRPEGKLGEKGSGSEVDEGVKTLSINMSRTSVDNRKSNSRKSFSLRSLQAFDDLSDKGLAVEVDADSEHNGSLIEGGMRVVINCMAMSWDGASTVTKVCFDVFIGCSRGQQQPSTIVETAIYIYDHCYRTGIFIWRAVVCSWARTSYCRLGFGSYADESG